MVGEFIIEETADDRIIVTMEENWLSINVYYRAETDDAGANGWTQDIDAGVTLSPEAVQLLKKFLVGL